MFQKINSKIFLEFSFFIVFGLMLLAVPFSPFAKAATSTATLSVTVLSTLSLSINSTTVAIPNLTPGTPVSAISTSTVLTNNSTGFSFSLHRNTAGQTLSSGSNTITDKTAWAPGANTSTPGNAATYSGTGLAFRVPTANTSACAQATSWWGSDGSPLHAGTNTSATEIANCGSYQAASTSVAISYYLDVPSTQPTGAYTGGVTYTAVVNP